MNVGWVMGAATAWLAVGQVAPDGNIGVVPSEVLDRGTLGSGDNVINAFLATFAASNPAWIAEVELLRDPADLPPGKRLGHSSLLGYYAYRPKTVRELTRRERETLLNDPRLRGFVATLRRPVDPLPVTSSSSPSAVPSSVRPTMQAAVRPGTPGGGEPNRGRGQGSGRSGGAGSGDGAKTVASGATGRQVDAGPGVKGSSGARVVSGGMPSESRSTIQEGSGWRWRNDTVPMPEELLFRLVPEEALRRRPARFLLYGESEAE